MRKNLLFSLFLALLLAGLASAQTPDCSFNPATITTNAPTAHYVNRVSPTTGTGCVAWILRYTTTGATAVSVQIEGSAVDAAGNPTGGYTPLTVQTGITGNANPATGTAEGFIVACCDYYPAIRINPTIFTGTAQKMNVRVTGWISTAVARGGAGGGGINQLTGDGTAGPGSGSQALTVNESGNLKGGALGAVPYQTGPGATGMTLANTTTLPQCLVETGTGVVGAAPVFAPCPSQSTLIYYLQNSVVSSAVYSSGGSFSGTGNCTLDTFNGGGSGATASIAVAGGTPGLITITLGGTNYTSTPTTAVLHNGTATCSGTATLTVVLNVPVSNVSGDFPLSQMPYAPLSTMIFPLTLNTAGTLPVASWVTAPGQPGLTFIPAGLYQFHIHAGRTNAFTGTVQLQGLIKEVDSTGAFIANIGVTELTPNLPITPTDYTLDFPDGNVYTLASSTSRIVLLVQSVQTSFNVAGNIQMLVGGTADPHLTLPSSGPGASGMTQLTQDVTAGPGSGSQPATVKGLDGVPFCNGFTPLNGQAVEYSTALVPNPCYTAAAPAGGVTSVYGLTGVVAPTAHNQSAALVCAAGSASTTTYTCSTTPTFVAAANDCILFVVDLGNTADSTLAVNGGSALHILKQQNAAVLVAGDLQSNGRVLACMDASSHWQLQGEVGNAPAGTSFYQTVEQATVVLTQRPTINFTGAGVTCADNGGTSTTDCTIPGGGGSGSFVLLEQHTANNTLPNLDFTTCISSTYDDYQIEIVNLVPATNTATLKWLFSSDGGSTFDGTTTWNGIEMYFYPGAGQAQSTTANNAYGKIAGTVSNNSAYGVVATVKLRSPLSTTVYKQLSSEKNSIDTNTGTLLGARDELVYPSLTAQNAFQLISSSGNLASGVVRCYGLAK